MSAQGGHLRLKGASPEAQRQALETAVCASPRMAGVLAKARALDLPDWWIVSGAIYNTVWNWLTDRPDMHGVKDIDLFYFDPDTSYDAEDGIIREVAAAIPGAPPVEVRNQARVHLWYERHFGHPYPALQSAAEGIDRFASRTHAIGLRLESDDSLTLYAPYGLQDVFAFRLTPNTLLPNRATHEAKAARQLAHWPELEFVPWPAEPSA
ncbi:hypothetical protein CLV78_101292 [Aliiruegeria haliotis]|uniref:Nucleotidyltransferase family protein n=1 Tax=Aliiruegeria haliotis TaxID=1280846 RepID=A0A2T0RYF6_9RHOB|nr:nucleotidyltransferase family protein [Aliiruegeria haliotis]PRY26197.1 hypothetical protein CLV78_101292 [Aliiruegeria haliotis]